MKTLYAHPPRLKLRTLIVLIALLAGMLAAGIGYGRRATRYRLLAAREAQMANLWKQRAAMQSAFARQWRAIYVQREQRIYDFERGPGPYTDDAVAYILAKRASRKAAMKRREDDEMLKKKFSEATRSAQRADFHARRSTAFLRAARYPWKSPPADEPEPE